MLLYTYPPAIKRQEHKTPDTVIKNERRLEYCRVTIGYGDISLSELDDTRRRPSCDSLGISLYFEDWAILYCLKREVSRARRFWLTRDIGIWIGQMLDVETCRRVGGLKQEGEKRGYQDMGNPVIVYLKTATGRLAIDESPWLP